MDSAANGSLLGSGPFSESSGDRSILAGNPQISRGVSQRSHRLGPDRGQIHAQPPGCYHTTNSI